MYYTTVNEERLNGTNALLDALQKVEGYYSGVIDWLATMFDKKTGGFYMATSGAKDPDIEPAIEMTVWGYNILRDYTNALSTAPSTFIEGLIEFMNERQDSSSGLFIDKQGPANSREVARNQDAALNFFNAIGMQTKYIHPRNAAKSNTSATVMPDYMKTPESYVAWIENWDWEFGSWTAGDQAQSSLQYVDMLDPSNAEKYKTALFKWLEARQFESGLYSPHYDFNSISGAFKVGLVYSHYSKLLPNHLAVIDSIFECYKTAKANNPFYVRNPISILNTLSRYDDEAKYKVQAGVIENIDAILQSFGEFLCPDGAFSAKKNEAMRSFGGVVGSHGLNEGDIDATMMMLIARKTLYKIFDIDAPYLNTDGFWDKIYS